MILLVFTAVALEIKSGTSDDLTIFLQNASSGQPLENATCYFDVWDPSNVKILDDGVASELSDGFYVYSTNASWTDLGNYRVLARCDIGIDNVFSAMMFEVVAATIEETLDTINDTVSDINTIVTDINTTVTDINTTVNNIYSYLQNTVYPAVDTLESSLADVLTNQSNIYSKLVDIQSNVTTNYDEIINAQTQLTNVNASIMSELIDHRDRLVELNTTTQNILNNITAAVIPKINSIQADADDLQTQVGVVIDYVDTLEGGQSDISGNLSMIISYVDTLESGVSDLDSDLVAWSANATTRFDTIDTSLSNIYTDTQSILTSGVELDSVTNATLNYILNYVNETNTTTAEIKSYLEGSVTDYLSDINTTVADINSTVTDINNTVNYLNQTLASIQGNVTSILTTVNDNNVDINSILTKWGSYGAQDIIDEIDENQANLSDMNDWLLAFNITEAQRFNDSNTLVQQILDWLPGFNDTEADRHNATQTLINTLLSEINDAQNLSNEIISYLGYVGKNSSVYDDLVALTAQNNQIITLAQEINLTTHAIDANLIALNATVGLIYSDTQSVLTKWGSFSMSDLNDSLNLIDGKLDIISVSSNNTGLLFAIADLESIVNDTRVELGFNNKSLTAYECFVRLESDLLAVNSSVHTKIETEHLATRSEVESVVDNSTNTLLTSLNNNQDDLNDLLAKWGSYNVSDVLDEIVSTRNEIIDVQSWLDIFNTTEEQRHQEVVNDTGEVLYWLNIFNTTERDRHEFTQEMITNMSLVLDDTLNLTNQLIGDVGYGSSSSSVYADLQLLLTQVSSLVGSGNLTGLDYVELYEGKNVRALPAYPSNISISAVMSSLDGYYYRVDWYNATSDSWLTFNPSDPFSNTLSTMEAGKSYTIWVDQDCVLFVE